MRYVSRSRSEVKVVDEEGNVAENEVNIDFLVALGHSFEFHQSHQKEEFRLHSHLMLSSGRGTTLLVSQTVEVTWTRPWRVYRLKGLERRFRDEVTYVVGVIAHVTALLGMFLHSMTSQ